MANNFNRYWHLKIKKNFFEFFNLNILNITIIVEFFSAATEFNVCKNLNCKAAGESASIVAASFNELLARCSPSAAITFKFIFEFSLICIRTPLL